MYKLEVKHFFDASHQLPDTDSLVTKACARLHGHTYAVIVELSSETLRDGMVIDFKAIKDVIDLLDHRHVNDIFQEYNFRTVDYNVKGPPVAGKILPSTAENIARFIYEMINQKLSLTVDKVSVCEGYKGQERSSWATYQ